MAGSHTPTEMLRAHRAGAPLQKLFPAPGIGAAYVKACLGPMPFLRIVPTAGVDQSNAAAYLAAGAFAVGFVAAFFCAVLADGFGVRGAPDVGAHRFVIGFAGEEAIKNVLEVSPDVEVVADGARREGHEVGRSVAGGNAADEEPVFSP